MFQTIIRQKIIDIFFVYQTYKSKLYVLESAGMLLCIDDVSQHGRPSIVNAVLGR